MENNISFKSKINFVSYNQFQKIIRQSNHYVPYGTEAPLYIKASNFYTESVRTCTAGGLTDTKNNSLGFHILDTLKNFENIKNIGNTLSNVIHSENIRGLLIGSKDTSMDKYSKNIFDNLKDILMQKISKISFFQEHQMVQSESFVHYDIKTDCWNICTRYKTPRMNSCFDVLSYEELHKAFKTIHIADGDELYINETRLF